MRKDGKRETGDGRRKTGNRKQDGGAEREANSHTNNRRLRQFLSRSFPVSRFPFPFLAAALSLRLWNLGFGLPDWYHPDEPLKAQAIVRIADGHLHPGNFYHPSFMLYAAALTLRLTDWVDSAESGRPADANTDPAQSTDRQLSAVLAGRATVALLGTATVGLSLFAGWLLAGPFVGWIAGVLMAIAPLHVVCSHYLKEDVPLSFWAVAVFVASLYIVREGRLRDYVVTGLLAGFATGTKYVGALFVALPWLAQRQRRDVSAPHGAVRAALLASAAGFLLVTPFALFDAPSFLFGVGHEGGTVFTGLAGIAVSPLPYLWSYHLRYSIIPGFGLLPTLLAMGGFVVAWRRRQPELRLLSIIVVVFYAVFESSPYKPPPNADRYVVPLLPFLALLAGLTLDEIRLRLSTWSARTATALMAACALAAVAQPLIATVRLTAGMTPDTRAAARDWLTQHACEQGDILIEGAFNLGGTIVPSYAPVLPERCHAAYAYSLERDSDRLDDFDFIVASSFAYERFLLFSAAPAKAQQFYRDFFATHQPVAEFTPSYRSYGFHNPTIRIYRNQPQ